MPYAKVADWFYKADLEALYEGCDLTYAQIAEPLGVSARTVYNWVTGETRPKSGMVRLFAEACGASEKRIKFLVHVVSQLDSGSLVSDLDKRNIFIVERAEATAGEIWKFEPWYIHGPLQLLRYHMDLLPGHEDSMQNWQRKYKRYLVLSERRPAPILRFLTTTNALRQLRGWEGAEEQFNRLLEVDSWPNCEIRILDGLHYGVEHAFDIFLPGGFLKAPPSLVYVETLDQSRHIEEVMQTDLYYGQVKRMWSAGQRIGGRLDDWIW
jgi:transcriptional regulator with XRE-family HTH domain